MLSINTSEFRKNFFLATLALLGITLSNCNRKQQNTVDTEKQKTESSQPKTQSVAKAENLKTIEKNLADTSITNKVSPEKSETITIPEKNKIAESTKKIVSTKEQKPSNSKQVHKTLSSHYKIYANLRKILDAIKTGETATKEELIASNAVPNDALKIVKSIRKVSENELEVKWKSVWMVEKISDVKLNDDTIKIKFGSDVVYTSGNAIGIEYNDKVYNNLIIKGDRAYIPSVKEYSWKIGR